MLITILGLAPGLPSTVECETPWGKPHAVWRGAMEPAKGHPIEVELDARGVLVWRGGSEIISADAVSAHGQTLRGLVESIDGNLVVLRVGPTLLSLDVAGEPPVGILGLEIPVTPAAFEVWPTGV